jgi:hypothetical protein
MKQRTKNKMFCLGLFGLTLTIILNLVAVLALKWASAGFFSDKWWSDWFPAYLVWMTLAIIGFAKYCRQKPVDTKADA